MMSEAMFDGAGYIVGDYGLAVLITMCALLTYARLAFERKSLRFPWPRMVVGVGFTLWAMRFWMTLWNNLDVMVAPVSMLAIGMVTSGYSLIQILAIRRAILLERIEINCFRDPELPCAREDRIQEAIIEELKR